MREGIAERIVATAFGDAERDPVRVIRARVTGRYVCPDAAISEVAVARVGERETSRRRRNGDSADVLGDRDFGAQLVEREPLDQFCGLGSQRFEQETVGGAQRKELEQDLALRRQQGGEARIAGQQCVERIGREVVEERYGVGAIDGDERALDQESCGERRHAGPRWLGCHRLGVRRIILVALLHRCPGLWRASSHDRYPGSLPSRRVAQLCQALEPVTVPEIFAM